MTSSNSYLLNTISSDARKCQFASVAEIEMLDFRGAPYWHILMQCRHVGIHRPDERICNWTARLLTKDKRYIQRCLGPALDTGRGAPLSYEEAVELALQWFDAPESVDIAHSARPTGRMERLSFSPIGSVYTVGHALNDYCHWTLLARSAGTHYNNLVLINYHIVPDFAQISLEEFNASHLAKLARNVLSTPPRFGFMARQLPVLPKELTPDELRRRKRTFNSLVSILRMAFRHAWDNGKIDSERPWRCLQRIPVVHTPRTIFLTREECRRLLDACTPALRKLVLGALYSGCRVGELGTLRVEDVGHQVFGIRIAAFKRSPARYVFLPDEGMAFFLSCCEGKSPRDRVFRSDMGKVWRKQHTNLFRRAVANAGLPPSFVFHGLRHTYASDLIRSGVSMDIVAKQLGHASSMTVSRTYGHLVDHVREAQIRSRFTTVDAAQKAKAESMREGLERLWQSFQQRDWREYGLIAANVSSPSRPFGRTHASVLEAFGEAEVT